MTKHIGIVAVSPEGVSRCYRQIFRHAASLLEPHEHPVVSVFNTPLAAYVDAVRRDDWRTVGGLLRVAAEKLAGIGAELVFTPDNAVQHGVHLAEVGSAVPWLNMTEVVAEAIERDGRHTVGIIGTLTVTGGSSYQTHLGMRGIKIVRPEQAQAEAVDEIIYSELAYGVIKPESQAVLLDVIDQLKDKGCEGVILGYSEAGLLLASADLGVPHYEPVDLLARRAIQRAMA